MIPQFDTNTALLLIDVQKGVNIFEYWGGASGRRNNPTAEDKQRRLLAVWRQHNLPVMFSRHDSREAGSPLKLALPTGEQIEGLEPQTGETVVTKDVNSAFIGTDLELRLREKHCDRLVLAGFFTNFCVETTVRMAGNLGYDTYLVHDACAACNRIGPDGRDHDPQLVHDLAVATMHGEFCTALSTDQAVALTDADAPNLDRVQGNE